MSNYKFFRRTAIAVAVSAVFPMAVAQADEVDDLINPNAAEVAIKLPYMNTVNPLYRQYNGVNHEGVSPNVDVDVVRRSEDGGWFKLKTENLGLSTQEVGASYEQQGNWAVGLDYNQIPRYSPYAITTAVSGIGSDAIRQPSYANGAFSSGVLRSSPQSTTTLSTERDITTLTASKFITDGLKLGFSFKNEEKTGTRMDGVRGVAGTGTPNLYSGFLFAPEPINQTHKQFEGTLEYVTSKYQLTVGYYGSFLNTRSDAMNVYGGTNTATVAVAATPYQAVSLAPDNSLQQFYLNGAYNFSSDTRGNLKFARSEGRQTDDFFPISPVNPNRIGSNLDGKVQTTEFSSSLTSRITKDFKLLGSWRYEDKSDKTPVRTFYTGYPNNPESHKANWGKAEADYNIGAGYGVTAGVDYTHKTSEEWDRRRVSELTSRLGIRKSMSETVNGTLSVAHSDREGSEWTALGTTIYPVYLADRKRNKARGMVDWAPAESVNLQVAYEAYVDDYNKSAYGLNNGEGQIFSLDGSYALNDNWKLNAWYSKQLGESTQNMRGNYCTVGTCAAGNAAAGWDARLKLNSNQFGFGANGKIKAIDLGAQYLYSRDENEQKISALPANAVSGIGVLPDTKYTINTFKLFGAYAVSKTTKLRLDYIYDIRKMDDYTWTNWVYADGTKVYVKPDQTTQILGLTLIQSF